MASSRVGARISACVRAQLEVDLREDGQRERGRLAGAGLRLAEQVGAAEDEREWFAPGWAWAFRSRRAARAATTASLSPSSEKLGEAVVSDIGVLVVPGEGSGRSAERRGTERFPHFPHPAPLDGARNVRGMRVYGTRFVISAAEMATRSAPGPVVAAPLSALSTSSQSWSQESTS